MSAQFESYFHFAQKWRMSPSRNAASPSALRLFLLLLEILQLPSQLRNWFCEPVCTVPPHLECPPDDASYVRTARKENALKVRLKLEPFHHEALWEVRCIWGGNKYCQTRAKRSECTALASVIFRDGIYWGCFFLQCCSNVAEIWPTFWWCHDLIVRFRT